MMNATRRDPLREAAGHEIAAWFIPGTKRTARQLLQHRLDVPDCIAQALTDDGHPDDRQYRRVLACIEILTTQGLRAAVADYGYTLVGLILHDCVDGSTYFGNADDAVTFGEISRATLNRHRRVAMEVANVVGTFSGLPVTFPQH